MRKGKPTGGTPALPKHGAGQHRRVKTIPTRAMKKHPAIAVILVAAAALAAFAQSSGEHHNRPAAGAKPAAAPFRVGERLEYRVAWGTALTAATSRLQVVERRPFFGREAWHFKALANTLDPVRVLYKLDDQFDSYTDTATLASMRYEAYIREQDNKEDKIIRMSSDGNSGQNDGPVVRVLPDTRDPLGFLYYMRTIDWRNTREATTPLYDGKKLYEIRMRLVAEREQVSVPAGEFAAAKINVRAYDRGREVTQARFAVWIAQDAARTPVMMQAELPFGELKIQLTSRN